MPDARGTQTQKWTRKILEDPKPKTVWLLFSPFSSLTLATSQGLTDCLEIGETDLAPWTSLTNHIVWSHPATAKPAARPPQFEANDSLPYAAIFNLSGRAPPAVLYGASLPPLPGFISISFPLSPYRGFVARLRGSPLNARI